MEQIINTDRLKELLPNMVMEGELVVDKKKKKKKKKPKPPTPTGPLKVWMYVSPYELTKFDLKGLGIDGIITHAGTDLDRRHQRFFWGNATEAEIRKQADWLLERSQGLPLHVFFHGFGSNLNTEVPWKADTAAKDRLYNNLKVWASTSIAGLIKDDEDEGRIARRDETTGAVTVPWWPDGRYAEDHASLIKSAVGTKPFDIYAIEYLQLNPYGYDGNLKPPTIPSYGWFRFMKALPSSTTIFSGGTYQSRTREDILGVESRFDGSGTFEIGNPNFVPGLWLNEVGESLDLLTAARGVEGKAWIYQDRGFLLNNPSELNRLKQVIA